MPPTKRRGETQLTCEEANKSRLVTLCRWVVETINGRFKRDFKIFRYRVFNRALPSTMTDYKIAAALINAFQEPYEDSQQFVDIINRNMHKPNLLADYVIEHNLNRHRAAFVRLEKNDQTLEDFPRLSQEELILFAVGTYHCKIARTYCSEHIKQTGVYEIEVYRHPVLVTINGESGVLIRCRIQSRHVRNRTYYTYILYRRKTGINAISEHYCSCIHGKRTLGSCAHIMSVLYYMGWARYQDDFNHPGYTLEDVIIDLENQ
ncbi:hypothetical protein PYW08_006147 [Mythimna loreyi]|uniref:Uncharacterized protein n=1 Tax=Mythimna loreyi TaxID=667449 RepID=A0ACC2QPE4_9NEOP|nr:hypothetical protein PYW08_006147 [Mythimna loreyi]